VIDGNDGDAEIAFLISAARAFVEKYCGTRLVTQTIEIKCDGFADFVRLPDGPIQSVVSIGYVDASGDAQTLSGDIFELRADGLEACIVLKPGQSWPAVQRGSRILVQLVAGYADVPADIKHALLLHVGANHEQRENSTASLWTAVDALLCNHRRGV
jgi:uncharacterized phiE125 gp8 family phage protein